MLREKTVNLFRVFVEASTKTFDACENQPLVGRPLQLNCHYCLDVPLQGNGYEAVPFGTPVKLAVLLGTGKPFHLTKVTLPVILGCPWSGVWVASETAAHSDVFFFSRANFFICEGKVRVSELVLRFCFSSWLVMAHIDLKVALTGDDRSI